MCADTVELNVSCYGCGQRIVTPSDADMELFRHGYRIHDDNDCFNLMLTNLGIA